MNIRFLETIVWLAHYRSFRMTGEHLHLTQPAISSRINMVEQELGVRLFERQAREVVVTPAGEAFVAEAREIVRRYDALVSRHRTPSQMAGLVRLGLASSMAHLLLPGITRDLRERHPNVKLEVITDDTADKLTHLLPARRIDVCLTAHAPQANTNLEVRPLCALNMVWVAAPGLLPPFQDYYSPKDLSRTPIITYAPGTLNASRIEEFFGAHFAQVPHLIASNSLATSVHMALNGIGVAVLPQAIVAREIALGALHVLHTHPSFPATSYSAIWLGDRNVPNALGLAQLAQAAARGLSESFRSDVVLITASE